MEEDAGARERDGTSREGARERGADRERKPPATGRSKAQRREMHHLCSGLAALRAHHRVRVRQKERKRASVRKGEREGGRQGVE